MSGQPVKPLRIACIGECMIELGADTDGSLRQDFAGDTANLAVYLARLLPAARIHYVTALGDDAFSQGMMERWREEGIDTRLVRRLPDRLPGIYWIRTDAAGERSFYYWRQHSAARALLSEGFVVALEKALAGFDLVCLSGISLAILSPERRDELLGMLARLRKTGLRVMFDTNFRAQLWDNVASARHYFQTVLAIADIVITSVDDEQAVFGDDSAVETRNRLIDAGVDDIVVRQGPGPCLVYAQGRLDQAGPEPVAEVRDTTGAGDAFDAAYLAARLEGQAAVQAARAAQVLAIRVIAHPGAILPREATPELADLLAS